MSSHLVISPVDLIVGNHRGLRMERPISYWTWTLGFSSLSGKYISGTLSIIMFIEHWKGIWLQIGSVDWIGFMIFTSAAVGYTIETRSSRKNWSTVESSLIFFDYHIDWLVKPDGQNLCPFARAHEIMCWSNHNHWILIHIFWNDAHILWSCCKCSKQKSISLLNICYKLTKGCTQIL